MVLAARQRGPRMADFEHLSTPDTSAGVFVSGSEGGAGGSPGCGDRHVHRLSLIKGPERWNFRWEDGDEPQLISHVAAMARDAAVPFDWFDAAVVCKHIAQPLRPPSGAAQTASVGDIKPSAGSSQSGPEN